MAFARSVVAEASKVYVYNQTSLDHIGLIYAVPTARGRLSIGLGYDRVTDPAAYAAVAAARPAKAIVRIA